MKVVHINRQKISEDNDRAQRAELLRSKWERRARNWVRKKCAALLAEKRHT
jgi:hypothetical protein